MLGLIHQHPWIRGVHIHVGSHGVPLEKFVTGIAFNREQCRNISQLLVNHLEEATKSAYSNYIQGNREWLLFVRAGHATFFLASQKRQRDNVIELL